MQASVDPWDRAVFLEGTASRPGAEMIASVDGTVVDVPHGTITASGSAPNGTVVALRDPNGQPIVTTSSASKVPVVDYSWRAVFPIPSGDHRLYRTTAATRWQGAEVASAYSIATIPIRLQATVSKYTADKVVIDGKGGADGRRLVPRCHGNRDPRRRRCAGDGAARGIGRVHPHPRPRLITGRTIVMTQTLNGKNLGSTALTF